MPRNDTIKKVLVIGSGPIIIGQAAEFDYAGTQACRALKEENIYVILINSNPATIMTDTHIADVVYIEPLTVGTIKKIIRTENPDSILPTLGGQTALNLAMELAEDGILEELGIRLLGTPVDSIKKAEDRQAFKDLMEDIGEPITDSIIANDVDTALAFAKEIGYPIIVRPAYTLGGTGGGMAANPSELKSIAADGIKLSRVHQVLIEKSLSGWKEIEYEVIRDGKGNCITVCNMENIDPVGVHTGDSIVVAPSQTLRDVEYQMLRSASINIINALGIEGGCNVQYALDPMSMSYYVIEVNPRVSRSSALASKATGYPIARVATKIAVGYGLDEIINDVTGKTYACFEPTLDYVVVKIPKWPFDKFVYADKNLGTKMKATGEVMAIGSNLEEALLKAVRSLELGLDSLELPSLQVLSTEVLVDRLMEKTDERLFVAAESLRRGILLETIAEKTQIDPFFLNKLKNIIKNEEKLKEYTHDTLNEIILKKVKRLGFSDNAIARFTGCQVNDIRKLRNQWDIRPTYKMVDTCAAEFEAVSPYYYSTYLAENEYVYNNNPKVVVLGSGPIRIGQGIEFDYCSVHSIWALEKLGYETVIINSNPETVSTDFDISDRLYFEPLTPEDVLNILEMEKPDGVVVQFGGQTAIKLVKAIHDAGYKILGSSPETINTAEDREAFDALLTKINMARPEGRTVLTSEDAVIAAEKLGYPVLVRPSYVLGGQGMEIAYNKENIVEYMSIIGKTKQEHPILIDKYLIGKEIEVDAICDGQDILIPGIMEHIERAGVHSGDSISVYPPQSLQSSFIEKIVESTRQLAISLKVIGLMNIQYIEHQGDLYIIEVNPRSSRTIPYISKVTGVPMVELATRVIMGEYLKDMGYGVGLYPTKNIIAVKVPVFSFDKLPQVEISLGPEMKSTGEVLGIGHTFSEALFKGFVGAGYKFEKTGNVFISVANPDKQEVIPLAYTFYSLGFNILATSGTAHVLNSNFIPASVISRIGDESPNILDYIEQGKIHAIINTPTKGRIPQRDGFKIRRKAVENAVPCMTSLDTAGALLECLKLAAKADDAVSILAIGGI